MTLISMRQPNGVINGTTTANHLLNFHDSTSRPLRAATCTPKDFPSDSHFWGRDTGLICRSLRQIGVDCQCIVRGNIPGMDDGGALRTSMSSLESPDWWHSQKLQFVVLYAWGDPRYLPIARAIREAGIFLIQNLDSSGIKSPYADIDKWWDCMSTLVGGPQSLLKKIRLVARMARDFVPAIYERNRIRMLEESNILAAVSPPAADTMREYVEALHAGHLTSRIHVIPHAVSDAMAYDGRQKTKTCLCVGRWNKEDWHQKNPTLTLKVARSFCMAHPDWTFEIIGRGADKLSLHFPSDVEPMNLRFTPQLDREDLRERYQTSALFVCTSRYESYHIASAEALCAGCRIIVPQHPLLASTAWFTQNDSGTIAKSHDLAHLLAALEKEIALYEHFNELAASRARNWQALLSSSAVANSIFKIGSHR